MANPEHVEILQSGVENWNEWRKINPLVRPDLSGAVLASLDLSGGHFEGANLSSADLSRTLMYGTSIWNAVLRHANLREAAAENADLENADLSFAMMRGASFDGANMTKATVVEADLEGGSLSGALLEETDFRGAVLRGVEFTDTSLMEVNLENADLANANLSRAEDFNGFNLLRAKGLSRAIFSDSSVLPKLIEETLSWCNSDQRALFEKLDSVELIRREFVAGPVAQSLILLTSSVESEIAAVQKDSSRLALLSPRDFELFVAELLRGFGWKVEVTASTRDGGYDIFGITSVEPNLPVAWVVECKKHARHRPIGVGIVRSLYGVDKVLYGGANILIATTSTFTKEAKNYESSRYDLSLRDYCALLEWVHHYKRR